MSSIFEATAGKLIGPTTGLAQATNIAAGSFKITVANLSAGSLGEAIVLSFVALKGASS